jgi:hypothetical protein
MTKIFFLPVLLIFFTSLSCKDENVSFVLSDHIIAGQKDGSGIEYVDLEPDLNCTIVNAWNKVDTSINLDLNKDGIDDFTLKRNMLNPVFLGGDWDTVIIIPLMNNEICIDSKTNWLDTLSSNDTVNSSKNWSNRESLIYSNYFVLGGTNSTEGNWYTVSKMDRNYIGFNIKKDEKIYYGWIGMYADSVFRHIDFMITDYALLKDYPE